MPRIVVASAALGCALLAADAGLARADASRGRDSRVTRQRTAAVDMQALQLQVALDRAGFSVGAIDGKSGARTRKALAAFQQAHAATTTADPVTPSAAGAAPTAAPTAVSTAAATAASTTARDASAANAPRGQLPPIDTPATIEYTVTDADAAGPFVDHIPKDLQEQGSLETLAYTSIVELLAERFHTTPALLRALNPSLEPVQSGRTIVVPNVEPMTLPESSGRRRDPAAGATHDAGAGAGAPAKAPGREHHPRPAPAFDVTVSRGSSDVVVRDANGAVRFYAPVSSGSEHDPLPIGEWTVEGVYLLPVFFYNPELFWDADPSHAKTKIPAGPNNPVGTVWIDISRPHYGLHGTPEPTSVGVTQSHGCVRLTNWDALRLAAFVTDGTAVHFTP